MPKKSAPAHKKIKPTAKKRHFLWATFFFAATTCFNIYLISTAVYVNTGVLWPLSAASLAILTLILIGRERKGVSFRNNSIWSFVFATLTTLITFSIAMNTNYDIYPLASWAFATLGLIVLYWEKYRA